MNGLDPETLAFAASDERLRQEGRQQEREAILKELRAVGRVLDRRDEPGSQVVAMLIDWVNTRTEGT